MGSRSRGVHRGHRDAGAEPGPRRRGRRVIDQVFAEIWTRPGLTRNERRWIAITCACIAKSQGTTRSWAVHLGVVSFAFYLTQSLVLPEAHQRLIKHIPKLGIPERCLLFVALLGLSLLLAEILHDVVERNAEIAIRKRLLGQPAPARS